MNAYSWFTKTNTNHLLSELTTTYGDTQADMNALCAAAQVPDVCDEKLRWNRYWLR